MKNIRLRTATVVMILFIVFLCAPNPALAAFKNAQDKINDAQKNGKYIFVMFYEKKDAFYKAMKAKIKDYIKNSADKPSMYRAKITDSKEAEIIAKYRVTGAPMPLLLVFAPNGVVTGGFPRQVNEQQLKSAFPSELILKVLKPLQEGKLVLVLFQNDITKYNKESAKAAEEFKNTQGLRGAVEIIKSDPNSEAGKELLTQAKVVSPVTESTIVMIVPPGRIGGVFQGKTNKKKLMTGLKACSGGSCCSRK